MRTRNRLIVFAAAGLLFAAGLGLGAHLVAGDSIGLAAVGISGGEGLAPPEASEPAREATGVTATDRASSDGATGADRGRAGTQQSTGGDDGAGRTETTSDDRDRGGTTGDDDRSGSGSGDRKEDSSGSGGSGKDDSGGDDSGGDDSGRDDHGGDRDD